MKANKPTFLGHSRPLLTCMVQAENPTDAINIVRNAAYDGCDAYGFQICRFAPRYRDKKTFHEIFRHMEDKPIYITNYRDGFNQGLSDEECAEGLLFGLECGATLCDVMGDLYAPGHPLQLTDEPAAVDRQRALIDRIHERGGEVILSSHVMKFLPAGQVVELALKQQARGADVVKIVCAANSDEEQIENLRITTLLRDALDVPFLFLSGGTHYKLHRMIGPMLGCAMYLTVQQHDPLSTKSQPVLRSVRAVLDNFDYKPDRAFED